jgi:hypothetical protein
MEPLGSRRAGLAVALVAGGFLVVQAPGAGPAALTSPTWTVSSNQAAATGVTYSYSFKTATAGSIDMSTFAVSGAGSPVPRRS